MPAVKLSPDTVSVNAGLPCVVVDGFSVVNTGAGVIVKVKGAESAPGPPLTVTPMVPGAAIRLAGTSAVSCDALTKVVANGVPSKFTSIPLEKFAPFTVKVNAAAPAVREGGRSAPIVGSLPIVKVTPFEATPSPVRTVTVALPAAATSAAGTAAVNCAAP
jgi:hypothetical protein